MTPSAHSNAAMHLAISDSSGDSVIFEYVGGKLQIPAEADYDITEEEISRAMHK